MLNLHGNPSPPCLLTQFNLNWTSLYKIHCSYNNGNLHTADLQQLSPVSQPVYPLMLSTFSVQASSVVSLFSAPSLLRSPPSPSLHLNSGSLPPHNKPGFRSLLFGSLFFPTTKQQLFIKWVRNHENVELYLFF